MSLFDQATPMMSRPPSLDRAPMVTTAPNVTPGLGTPVVRVGPSADVAALVEATLELPPMPAVAQRVFMAAQDPNVTTEQLAHIINSDPALVTKLLAVCNSSFYGLRRRVSSVQHAVTLLGFRELFNLVVSTSARYLFRSMGPQEQYLWEHSIACALASHLVAERLHPGSRDLAFVAGQLHDVGHAVLNLREPLKLAKVFGDADGVDVQGLEIKAFGVTHADIGSLVMRRWNLPPGLEAAAFLHHDPMLCSTLTPDYAPLVSVVTVANHVCHLAGQGRVPKSDVPPLEVTDALDNLGVDSSVLESLVKEFKRVYASERSKLD